jgi:choloylglycine hydrolase
MCTNLRLVTGDHGAVVARTMEFPDLLQAKITAIPRGYASTAPAPDGSGKAWQSVHGVVGIDAFGQADWLTDGMNERGLYAGLLYMPGYCEYTPADGAPTDELLAIVNVVAYLLGTCSSVEEVKMAMHAVTVWPLVVPAMGFAPPAHVVVHDVTGASAVVEWIGGEMVIFDNPIGVVTNSPHLDWHLTNLENYVALSPFNPATRTVEGVELAPLGQGPGMTGLPADASAPSRFVRAVAYVATIDPIADAAAGEMAALHIINNFDIPQGFVRAGDGGKVQDTTLWTTISNLKDHRYIVRGVGDPNPLAIDLAKTSFDGDGARQVPIPTGTFAELSI